MLVMLLLFVALLFVASVYVVRIYNGLVALRENVRKAWANIDVLLTQRHDELPKLVETCKRYMGYEQETLERVMQARVTRGWRFYFLIERDTYVLLDMITHPK